MRASYITMTERTRIIAWSALTINTARVCRTRSGGARHGPLSVGMERDNGGSGGVGGYCCCWFDVEGRGSAAAAGWRRPPRRQWGETLLGRREDKDRRRRRQRMLRADGISDFQSSYWRQTGRVQCGSIAGNAVLPPPPSISILHRILYFSSRLR